MITTQHLIYYAQACANEGCLGQSNSLSRCSRCRRVAYCSTKCQATDHPSHKKFCAKFAELRREQNDKEKPPDFQTTSREDLEDWAIRTARADCIYLSYLLGSPITMMEQNLIIYEPRCITCYRREVDIIQSSNTDKSPAFPLRFSLMLCAGCHSSFACSKEHWNLARASHQDIISEYGMSHCQLHQQNTKDECFQQAFEKEYDQSEMGCIIGGLGWITTYQRDSPLRVSELARARELNSDANDESGLSSIWRQVYQEFRDCAIWNLEHVRINTRWQTNPLTILFCLDEFVRLRDQSDIRQPYFDKNELILHVMAATQSDLFYAITAFEELLFLLPSLYRLEVHFIGPELNKLDASAKPQYPLVTNACITSEKSIEFLYHEMLYHQWVDERPPQMSNSDTALVDLEDFSLEQGWYQPDLAIAFNAGVHETPETWYKTIEFLAKNSVPTVLTGHNQMEVEADAQIVKACFGKIVIQPQRNPFQCATGKPEPCGVRGFFFSNGYMLGFQGLE